MNLAATMQAVLPSAEAKGNFVRRSWDRLSPLPGGKRIFSRLVGYAAPYTGTIGARVMELRAGYARVELADRRAVRNHLDCVHAIALANLAEITGNVAVAYSLPDDARFIVAGFDIEYRQKARGKITGVSTCPRAFTNERAEYRVEVSLRNEADDEVAHCTLRTLVGPKR